MTINRQIFVVEFKPGKGKNWDSCDGFFVRSNAKSHLEQLKKNCPADQWRIAKYIPEEYTK